MYIYMFIDSMSRLVHLAHPVSYTVAKDPFLTSKWPTMQQCMVGLVIELLWTLPEKDFEIDAIQALEETCSQYQRVRSAEIQQDVLRQDRRLPKLFNHGLIRTIVSQETRLVRI